MQRFSNFNPLQREAEDRPAMQRAQEKRYFNPLQREAEDRPAMQRAQEKRYFNPLQREAEDSKYSQFHLSSNTFPYTNPPTFPIPFTFSSPETSHKPYFNNYILVRIPHRFMFAYLSHHFT